MKLLVKQANRIPIPVLTTFDCTTQTCVRTLGQGTPITGPRPIENFLECTPRCEGNRINLQKGFPFSLKMTSSNGRTQVVLTDPTHPLVS